MFRFPVTGQISIPAYKYSQHANVADFLEYCACLLKHFFCLNFVVDATTSGHLCCYQSITNPYKSRITLAEWEPVTVHEAIIEAGNCVKCVVFHTVLGYIICIIKFG